MSIEDTMDYRKSKVRKQMNVKIVIAAPNGSVTVTRPISTIKKLGHVLMDTLDDMDTTIDNWSTIHVMLTRT